MQVTREQIEGMSFEDIKANALEIKQTGGRRLKLRSHGPDHVWAAVEIAQIERTIEITRDADLNPESTLFTEWEKGQRNSQNELAAEFGIE